MATILMLRSNDDQEFKVSEGVAFMSQMIKDIREDVPTDTAVPLTNVDGKTLAKVLEYCKYHFEADAEGETKKTKEEIKSWDAEFLKLEQGPLFDLILAANYLNIQGLLDLTCEAVANMIKGKTPEEIRTLFNIQKDLTEEEENQLYAEIEWKFE